MIPETINTLEVVGLFHHLMQQSSQMRVLLLTGAAKMGKSHLLTKVFPLIALQQYQASCAILDLRNRLQTVPDMLHTLCSQFGTKDWDGYYAAHQAWSNRPKVEVRGLLAKFSRIDISARDSMDDARSRDRHLTTQFANDLSKRNNLLQVFLIDSVESASEEIHMWLMEMLLLQIARFEHIRVVIAGRSLPEAHGSYRALCQSSQLSPVTEMEEYLTYCRKLGVTLVEQSIRDFAYACNYTPGMFVDLVLPKFVQQRISHG